MQTQTFLGSRRKWSLTPSIQMVPGLRMRETKFCMTVPVPRLPPINDTPNEGHNKKNSE